MRFHPAVGGEVHNNAGGQEAERDGQCADDPGKLDAALEHEVVEDAEDQDQHGGFREEGGAAAGGYDGELKEGRRHAFGRHDAQVGFFGVCWSDGM